MKILIIDPKAELIVHNLEVSDKESAHRVERFTKQLTAERGELDRILIAGGTCRIMDPTDPIPVPIPAGRPVR